MRSVECAKACSMCHFKGYVSPLVLFASSIPSLTWRHFRRKKYMWMDKHKRKHLSDKIVKKERTYWLLLRILPASWRVQKKRKHRKEKKNILTGKLTEREVSTHPQMYAFHTIASSVCSLSSVSFSFSLSLCSSTMDYRSVWERDNCLSISTCFLPFLNNQQMRKQLLHSRPKWYVTISRLISFKDPAQSDLKPHFLPFLAKFYTPMAVSSIPHAKHMPRCPF